MRLEALDAPMDLQGIHFSEPFGFLDYNHLQMNAFCVLSDSGTISEEASILRLPSGDSEVVDRKTRGSRQRLDHHG